MGYQEEVCDLMAENGQLRAEIERLRALLKHGDGVVIWENTHARSGFQDRRVIDRHDYSKGTAVEDLGRGRYRVHWDQPTPYQKEAKVPIPSADFAWADAR